MKSGVPVICFDFGIESLQYFVKYPKLTIQTRSSLTDKTSI